MNCGELQNRLVEAGRGARDREALAHAASCSACALRLSVERALTVELRAFARAAQAPPQHLEATLLAAFARNRKAGTPVWRKWFAAGGAIAAAVILVLGWSASPPPPVAIARVDIPVPEPAATLAEPALAKRHRKRSHPAVKAVTTEFYPIPYAEPLSGLERAELVRVRMDNRIEADLVIGQDGLARAIRFVGNSPVLSQIHN